MLLPAFPTTSWALKENWPKPAPIAVINRSVPFQLLPAPESRTATFVPTGGAKVNVGAVPGPAGSERMRLTATVGLFVVCTGVVGAVAIVAAGGTVSIVKTGPPGVPLKTLPARSCAVA